LRMEQEKDSTLGGMWKLAEKGTVKETKNNASWKVSIEKGVLYRLFRPNAEDSSRETKQVLVPLKYRKQVMTLAHESIVGGHLGARKTADRITSSFHWPGVISDVTRFCRSCDIIQAPVPDHKGICLSFTTSDNKRGRGYWKINNSIIEHREYQEGIKRIFEDVTKEYNDHVSKSILWDYLKLKFKQYSIWYSINQAKLFNDQCKKVESQLDDIDDKLANSIDQDNNLIKRRRTLKNELDELYEKKAKGYQIRSRAKWVEKGEKSSQYFLNLENQRQGYNCINSLKDRNGKSKYTDKEILHIASKYYANLYEEQAVVNNDLDEYFTSIMPNSILNDEMQSTCDGLLTHSECLNAIKKMKPNKSPGLDGLTIEFYAKFWELLGEFLVSVYNESYENGVLPSTQRLSVFSLIFKNGDEEEISNYRPISLTNVDYRILAFVLSNRLQNVIKYIISEDQTAYIKNRYMGFNIRLVNDVIDYFDVNDMTGILFFADFKKAFDSLNWEFMNKTLEFFNFGQSFKKWIKTIYTDPEAVIKNNGHLSDNFEIHRGVRQGCPVSALLFVLCVEILGLKVRQHTTLKGYDFGYNEKPVKIMQYADDCVLYLNNRNELCEAISLLDNFGKLSGLVLNISKCEGLWLGKDKHKQVNCKLYGIRWPKQVKCLGIYVGYYKEENMQRNWIDKITKVENIIKAWEKRNLSLFGKIQILKTFAISQFILPASLLIVPDGIVKQINSIMYKFLWGNRDKVNRLRVTQHLERGGLNMLDLNTLFMSLKAIWVNKLLVCNPNQHNWAQIPCNYFIPFRICNLNLCFNFDNDIHFPELNQLCSFYRDVFTNYNKACICDLDTFKLQIYEQCIWGNKFIILRRGNKKCALFLRNWIRSGIIKISDLEFIDGILDENFVHRSIGNKKNLWQEIFIVKNALLPYRDFLRNLAPSHIEYPCLKFIKSKEYYVVFHRMLSKDIISVNNFLAKYYTGDDAFYIYNKKVKLQKEIKLKEFNFKMLHGILPCNLNLFRWKLRSNPECDVCGLSQNIEHLIFDCSYVRPLWQKFEETFDVQITFLKVMGIEQNNHFDFLITLLSFLIYKDWLLHSLENRCRNTNMNIEFYRHELCLRYKIYTLCSEIFPNDLESIEIFTVAL